MAAPEKNYLERDWPEFNDGRAILLPNGEYIIKRYGEYAPCITFVLEDSNIIFQEIDPAEYGLEMDCTVALMLPGEFWISNNNNVCFRPRLDGEYMLIATEWGGCCKPSRGTEWKESDIRRKTIYNHRSRSKNKGLGNCFYVFYNGQDHSVEPKDDSDLSNDTTSTPPPEFE